MKKYLLAAGALLATAQMASAGVIVGTSAQTDLGGGLYAVDITLSDGGSTGSWAADLTVAGTTGSINQNASILGAVKVESNATLLNGVGGYDKATDTFATDPFGLIGGDAATTEGSNTAHYLVGTGGGLNFGDVSVIQLVGAMGQYTLTGTVGRAGVTTQVSQIVTLGVPEPTSLGLLGVAGLGLLRRRRA